MKVFEKILKKVFKGKKLAFVKRRSSASGYASPNHYGGVFIRGYSKGKDLLILDYCDSFLTTVIPHGANPESNLDTRVIDDISELANL